MRCVVGNCIHAENRVKRHYWRVNSTIDPIENHAYMDLCSFHSSFFTTKTIQTVEPGWDPIKEG